MALSNNQIVEAYLKGAKMIDSCRTISHLMETRTYLKLFEKQLENKHSWMVSSLNDMFQSKKRGIQNRYENRSPKKKKTDEGPT